MDMGKVEDWLSAVPSKYTRKTHKAGIRKFEEFYQQGIETLIGKSPEETGHVIDKFYTWLKDRGHGQNTCRNLVNSPIQFLKFFGTEPKYKRSLGIYRISFRPSCSWNIFWWSRLSELIGRPCFQNHND